MSASRRRKLSKRKSRPCFESHAPNARPTGASGREVATRMSQDGRIRVVRCRGALPGAKGAKLASISIVVGHWHFRRGSHRNGERTFVLRSISHAPEVVGTNLGLGIL